MKNYKTKFGFGCARSDVTFPKFYIKERTKGRTKMIYEAFSLLFFPFSKRKKISVGANIGDFSLSSERWELFHAFRSVCLLFCLYIILMNLDILIKIHEHFFVSVRSCFVCSHPSNLIFFCVCQTRHCKRCIENESFHNIPTNICPLIIK